MSHMTISTNPCNTKLRDKVAIIWQGDAEDEVRRVTYGELHAEVCKFANALKATGVKKGDRVAIYMPMMVEAVAQLFTSFALA
jgi:acetyl-CoA synthetase